jgi:hypothetical protein
MQFSWITAGDKKTQKPNEIAVKGYRMLPEQTALQIHDTCIMSVENKHDWKKNADLLFHKNTLYITNTYTYTYTLLSRRAILWMAIGKMKKLLLGLLQQQMLTTLSRLSAEPNHPAFQSLRIVFTFYSFSKFFIIANSFKYTYHRKRECILQVTDKT